MNTVRKVNLRGERGETTQGFYVIDADGGAYGYNNNRDVDRVLAFMKGGLDNYRSSPKQQTDSIEPVDDGIPDPPPGATTLRVYQRIIPVPQGADPANQNVQRDHFWLLESEAKDLALAKVSDTLSLRLCRFVFNDAIRGEPDMWHVSEIRKRTFAASKVGDHVELTGHYEMRTMNDSRGLQGKLFAEVRFAGSKVIGFKGVADATAWGQSTYTPNPPKGKFSLKFAFVIAPESIDTVAPQAAFFGQGYLTGR
ncbi:MAG: hypothetical protein M3R13_01555 [Armatimonadota bacterium]|nr:hypothetical protein [Armatimonadota bacterium]